MYLIFNIFFSFFSSESTLLRITITHLDSILLRVSMASLIYSCEFCPKKYTSRNPFMAHRKCFKEIVFFLHPSILKMEIFKGFFRGWGGGHNCIKYCQNSQIKTM